MTKYLEIDSIFIIQSLEEHENKTGNYFKEEFEYLVNENNLKIEVNIINCENFKEFKSIINGIINDDSINYPWIHIDCHGSIDNGLEFSNGSEIGWDELRKILIPLNIKAKFNLPLSLSTCYGANFLGEIGSDKMEPSPCRLLMGPTTEVSPADLMRNFRSFYRNLFYGFNLKNAVEVIEKSEDGDFWLIELAERWFVLTMLDYIRTHCNDDALNVRARRIYKKLKKVGAKHKSISSIAREMKRDTLMNYIPFVFNQYFAIEYLPENKEKFSWVLQEIYQGVKRLKDRKIISFCLNSYKSNI